MRTSTKIIFSALAVLVVLAVSAGVLVTVIFLSIQRNNAVETGTASITAVVDDSTGQICSTPISLTVSDSDGQASTHESGGQILSPYENAGQQVCRWTMHATFRQQGSPYQIRAVTMGGQTLSVAPATLTWAQVHVGGAAAAFAATVNTPTTVPAPPAATVPDIPAAPSEPSTSSVDVTVYDKATEPNLLCDDANLEFRHSSGITFESVPVSGQLPADGYCSYEAFVQVPTGEDFIVSYQDVQGHLYQDLRVSWATASSGSVSVYNN